MRVLSKIFFLLLISSSILAKVEAERLVPRESKLSLAYNSTKYSIEELVIFKSFANTTKVKDFLIGDNGEGGGTKDFQVEREINELLQELPDRINEDGKGEILISHKLAKARKKQISLFSVTSYSVRRNYLFKEVESISIDEIEFFYLTELKRGEDVFTFGHLEGFKTKNGKVYFKKHISKININIISD
jgi:hypothetical protein